MALPQEIGPLNAELMDTLVRTRDVDWIPDPGDPKRGSMKILWTCEETGRWAVLFRWLKGYVAPQHKHLTAAHTFEESKGFTGYLGWEELRRIEQASSPAN